jgi:hypothetical protein
VLLAAAAAASARRIRCSSRSAARARVRPCAPSFTLPPELALALFVAPVLLDARYDASLRDLRDNWAPVTSLVVVAVGLTTIHRRGGRARARAGPPVGGRDCARRDRRATRCRRGDRRVASAQIRRIAC